MNTEVTDKLIEHVTDSCKAIDQERIYDDMLDECYSFEKVGGPFESMQASRVLKEVDPTAYRCGMNDYFGTDDTYFEIGSELYSRDDVHKARDEFADGIDSEISDLEKEIEEMESDEDHKVPELAALQRKLADLEADLKAVKQHVF